MMNLKQHIGLRVKSARREKGLTQEDLADRIGKAVATLSNIERGEALTGLETLALIAQATDKPMVFFFEGIEDTRPVSRKRLEAEEALRQLFEALHEDDLPLGIALIAAITHHRR